MLNVSEIHAAPFGRVLTSEVGTSAPVDVDSDYGNDWLELGYLSEDGVTITPTMTTESYKVWQSRLPAKILETDQTLELQFTMSQMNQSTTSLFFFDAEWVEEDAGLYRLDVKSDQLLKERQLSVEWTDDAGHTNRLFVVRGFVSNREALQLRRSAISDMGITFQALEMNGLSFYLLSDDPAMEPLAT